MKSARTRFRESPAAQKFADWAVSPEMAEACQAALLHLIDTFPHPVINEDYDIAEAARQMHLVQGAQKFRDILVNLTAPDQTPASADHDNLPFPES